MRSFFASILISLLFSSCKMQFQSLSVGNAENLKISKISSKGIEGEITVNIINPNKMGFTVYPSFVELSIAGIKLGKAEMKKKVFIPAHSSISHVFFINGNFGEIKVTDYMKIIGGKFGDLEINGNIKAGKWFLKKRIEISHKQKISLSNFTK